MNCLNPAVSGVSMDGGYAEMMIAEARGIASIPDELSSAEAAPLLCAGVTTYNALRNADLRGGDLVAVQGIGGQPRPAVVSFVHGELPPQCQVLDGNGLMPRAQQSYKPK